MKITKIEFINYKIFYGNGLGNIINIPYGKNMLIYGENGSGKSSIYEGLKQFFNSSKEKEIPYRNIYAKEINNNDVSVRITFSKEIKDKSPKTITFGTLGDDLKEIEFIKKANNLNSFFSYKEILRTYLFDTKKKNSDFKVEFAKLLLEDILVDKRNSETDNLYRKDWEKLFIPRLRAETKGHYLDSLIKGLKKDIATINVYLKSILKYFDRNFEVEITIDDSSIDYKHSDKTDRYGLHPNLKIDLKIKHYGVEIVDETQNHLNILNEAKLSSISISFYLSVLVFYAKSDYDYRILFLDDIFIGLDMSNRIPFLEILKNYIKPDGDDNEPFFNKFQIFITTYDKVWHELAKNFLGDEKWKYIEMYSKKLGENDYAIPVINENESFMSKAEYYLSEHDYKASAVYIRTEFERIVKAICEKKHLKVLFKKNAKEIKSDDLWLSIKNDLNIDNIDKALIEKIETYRSIVMNPFSHYDLEKPEFKAELEKTIEAVKELNNLINKDIKKINLKKDIESLQNEIKKQNIKIENLKNRN